ncbi:MAG: hypothetical protein GY943_35345 [Chloroflexi bacterium]|nr:hypothetical protein [Chloroflexota bacterium]
MDKRLEKQIRKLNAQLKAAEAAHDHLEVAAVLSQRAGVYALRQRWEAAAADLGRVAGLAAADGEPFYQARALCGQAKALGNLPEQRDVARQQLRQAAQLYATADDWQHQVEALLQIAHLHMGDDNYQAVLTITEEAVDQIEQVPAAGETLLEIYQLRATAYLFLLLFDEAIAALETAVSAAKTHNLSQQAVEIQHQCRSLQSLVRDDSPPESLATLLQAAQAVGTVQVVQDIQLQQAQQDCDNGRYQDAIHQAEQIIMAVRTGTDLHRFIHYLYASLIIAQAEEALNNRVGVLTALLRCKVYLETHLDKGLGLMMDKLLDSLQQEWGTDGLQQAVAAYQKWVTTNGPVFA